jgi:hypothetical protein
VSSPDDEPRYRLNYAPPQARSTRPLSERVLAGLLFAVAGSLTVGAVLVEDRSAAADFVVTALALAFFGVLFCIGSVRGAGDDPKRKGRSVG